MANELTIIGLAGTNGSGKDTVGQILADRFGYRFISVTELLRAEAAKRNLPPERAVLRSISAEWRKSDGMGVLVDKAIQEFQEQGHEGHRGDEGHQDDEADGGRDKSAGLTVASIRHPGEVDRIHELGGMVVWIDADPRLRYERIQNNLSNRGRAEEDNKTFEQFLDEEAAEMNKPAGSDNARLDMAAVKSQCDKFLDNSHEDVSTLPTALKRILPKLVK